MAAVAIGGVSIASMADVPVVAVRGIEDQQAETVLGFLDRRLRDDQLFLVRGDFRLRRHEVERRRCADVHLRLVDAHELFREFQRRPARLHGRPCGHEVPIRGLHVGGRVDEAFTQARVGDVSVRPARRQLLPVVVDEKVPDDRLRDTDGQAGLHERVVAVQDAVAVGVGHGPTQVVGRPVPRQFLAQTRVRADDIVLLRHRRQEVRRWQQLVVGVDAGIERRFEHVGRCRHARVADLRIQAVGRQVHVVVERHLHGLIDRQPERGRRLRRGLGVRRSREAEREQRDERRAAHRRTRGGGSARNRRCECTRLACAFNRIVLSTAEDSDLRRIVEQRVGDRRDDECQQQRERLTAEDHVADGVIGAGADPAGHDERDHAGDESERRHENWSQTIAAGLHDRVVGGHSGLLELVRVVDLQNRVLLDDAEQHQEAKGREDVQRLPEDDDRQQREGQGQRQRQQDRDRVQPRFELCRQDEIHEDEREDEGGHEILRGAPEFARAAGEDAVVFTSGVELVELGEHRVLNGRLRCRRKQVADTRSPGAAGPDG